MGGEVSPDLFSVGIRKLICELNKLLGQGKKALLHFAIISFSYICIYIYKYINYTHVLMTSG